jgi:hypothetical protein
MKTIVLLFAIAVASPVAIAQMYKWVDKDGKTHYTDSPPPEDARKLAAPKGSSAPTPTAPASKGQQASRADGNAERTQRSFQPDEQAALRAVCAISLLESFKCHLALKRHCPMDELVKGIGGDPNKGLARDPRGDPNYDYRVEARGDDSPVSAVPRTAGLAGFYSDASGTYYNPSGAAGAGDRRVAGPINCPSESR